MSGILSCLHTTWLWSAHLRGPSCFYHHLKALSQNSGTVDGSGCVYLHRTILLIVKSTGQLFCMLNCGAGRASFSLTIFYPYSLKEVFVLDSLISRLIYFSSRNAVLEFWMSLVICTQTTKRLSLLVASRGQIPSLVALGKAQNMRER